MKNLIKVLQDNFRCRMIVNYVVNAPSSLTFVWRIVKGLLEQHTIRKIRILKEGKIEEMALSFASNQYEQKYGGSAPNATEFWPPVMPSGPYNSINEVPEQHLTNNSSYYEYFPPTKPKKSKKSKKSKYRKSSNETSESSPSDFVHIKEEIYSPDYHLEKIVEQTCENTESRQSDNFEGICSDIHEESISVRDQIYSDDCRSDGEASVRTLDAVMDEQYLATTQKFVYTHQSESSESSPFLLEKLDRIYNQESYVKSDSFRSVKNEPFPIEDLSNSKRRSGKEDCVIDTHESPINMLCGGCAHERVMGCCMF